MFSRVGLNEERAANAIVKIAELLYLKLPTRLSYLVWRLQCTAVMRILLKIAKSLNFKRVGKGTVFTEISVVSRKFLSDLKNRSRKRGHSFMPSNPLYIAIIV